MLFRSQPGLKTHTRAQSLQLKNWFIHCRVSLEVQTIENYMCRTKKDLRDKWTDSKMPALALRLTRAHGGRMIMGCFLVKEG